MIVFAMRRIKMKLNTIGFLVGYFVFMLPFAYSINGSLIYGLLNGILGLIVTIGIEVSGR